MLNSNLVKLCEKLNDQKYHDSQSLASALQISRTTVYKLLKILKNHGVTVLSHKAKGYCMPTPLVLLNERFIKTNLSTPIPLTVFECLSSTNDYLKELVSDPHEIRGIVTEKQTNGRGRLNRTWFSPFGQNIYFSLRVPFSNNLSKLSGLSLVVGMAICHALEACLNINLMLKWPNDIFINQQKVSGTLIEILSNTNDVCYAIIGVGINVNMQNANESIVNQPWTSLLRETRQYQDRNKLIIAIFNQLMDYIKRFEHYGLEHFFDEWKKRDVLWGKSIHVLSGNQYFSGIATGINEFGHLLLKHADNSIQAFASGEASILK